MKRSSLLAGLIVSALLLYLPACASSNSDQDAVVVPLHQIVELGSESYSEIGSDPLYTITVDIPQLSGSMDGRVLSFNSQMVTLVYEDIDAFKENLDLLSSEALPGTSTLDITWEQLAPEGELLSLKFDVSFYTGGAHPGSYSRTATYDIEEGFMLSLSDLFQPGMDHLFPLSSYCLEELRASEIGSALFEDGASPTAENYGRWNVTADGLLITFDVYQVAAYAAGPQQVLVPWNDLRAIIDPDGPAGAYLP